MYCYVSFELRGTKKHTPFQVNNEAEDKRKKMVQEVLSPIGRGSRGGLVVRSRPLSRWVPDSKPDSIEDPPYPSDPLHSKSYVEGQTLSRWCGAEAWREVPIAIVVFVIHPWFKITRSVP
ncbi:hypothetical protein AVEN_203753-1 [Araneus ventricosus]|uniref:Uncharacterized protein n=1 Tax=Araneus ventricosus TaxID=182803 RepID=A0A4Y2GFT9_ARAVE|nr:hypothetical protein AVEN_203753-1 [Araneus ventricosus]